MIREFRKFNRSPAVMILLVLSIILSVVLPLFFMKSYVNYEYSSGEEIEVNGIEGLKLRKAQINTIAGRLTVKDLNDALALYKTYPSYLEAYAATEEAYPGVCNLLREAYSPYGQENDFIVNTIENADDFYLKQVEKIAGKMESYGVGYFSGEEKDEALRQAERIKKPLDYAFVDQWAVLLKALIFVNMIIIFSAIIISNQLFSYEKEKNMDLLLISISKKKLFRIAYSKISAMIGYLGLQFLICNIIIAGIVFVLLGVSGWNTQLQIMPEFYTVSNNWTFGETYLYYLIISWLCIAAAAFTGALINAYLQKTYSSLIISGLILIMPMLVKNLDFIPGGIVKILSVQPMNGVNLLSYIESLFSFRIGSISITSALMILITAAGYIILTGALSPLFFIKKINK